MADVANPKGQILPIRINMRLSYWTSAESLLGLNHACGGFWRAVGCCFHDPVRHDAGAFAEIDIVGRFLLFRLILLRFRIFGLTVGPEGYRCSPAP